MIDNLLNHLSGIWPWYIAGPIIGICVPLLLWSGNKSLGISSSLRMICAATIPGKTPFLNYNWREQRWNLFFVLGLLLSGFVGGVLLENSTAEQSTTENISIEGISQVKSSEFLPAEIFNFESLFTLRGFIVVIAGGFLIGFGTRWAGGCTSGHGIFGLSTFQFPSLVATMTYFIFGIISSVFLLPIILRL